MLQLEQSGRRSSLLLSLFVLFSPLTDWVGLPNASAGKDSTCNAGDTGDAGLVCGLGRSSGGGNGNPLQYSCLGNPMDRGAWQGSDSPWSRKETDSLSD